MRYNLNIESILLDLAYTGDISLLKTKSLDSNGIRETKNQFIYSNMSKSTNFSFLNDVVAILFSLKFVHD